MYIVVLLIGILLGMVSYSMLSVNRINEMQSLIVARSKSLANAEDRVVEKNKLIKNQSEEIKTLKARIVDLENNLELLTNNFECKKIKELVTDSESEN